VVVSVPARRSAWYDEVRAAMEHVGPGLADMMKQSPMYQLYAQVAPRPQDFPVLLAKTGELIRRDYDWSKEIAALRIPALFIAADADSFPPSHIAEIYGLLGGGQRDAGWDGAHRPTAQLAILPGTTHYDIFMSPLLPMVADAFLDSGAK
jgi:pimeloyl-ACP methyl ester carboxylesterase